MPDEIKIRFDNVSKEFLLIHDRPDTLRHTFTRMFRGQIKHEKLYALKGISFELKPGEALGIIGRNGSGKSTLLKIAGKILKPTCGHVKTNGMISTLITLGAGFHPELTGRENIFLSGALMGFSQAEMKERFDQIVSFSELGDFIDIPVRQYSSGMSARLGFSVSTEIDPDILVIDEVLGAGDEGFRKKCMKRMEGFLGRGRTILFVSHNLGAVERLCTRAILLDQGEIACEGLPGDVTARYRRRLEEKTLRLPEIRPPLSKIEA